MSSGDFANRAALQSELEVFADKLCVETREVLVGDANADNMTPALLKALSSKESGPLRRQGSILRRDRR